MRLAKLIVASAFAVSAPANAADWWWIGYTGNSPSRVITYLDKGSMRQLSGDALEVWTLAVAETPSPNGQQMQATKNAVRCKKGTFATLSRVGYGADGSKLPLSDVPPTPFAPVVTGSMAESILQLACGRPSGMELKVADPFQHAAAYLYPPPKEAQPSSRDASQQQGVSYGTGFFIGPAGDVLTSYHVVQGARQIGCRTSAGKVLEASVRRVSPANDLAVLRVSTRPAHYLTLAPRGTARAGDRVFTIGYGAAAYLGTEEPSFTEGAISSLSGADSEDAYMQISVPVQPGNSGGPLLNEAGQVVGIIAAQAAVEDFYKATGTLPQSINWAVKSDYASPLLNGSTAAPSRTRSQAITNARASLCLIIAER